MFTAVQHEIDLIIECEVTLYAHVHQKIFISFPIFLFILLLCNCSQPEIKNNATQEVQPTSQISDERAKKLIEIKEEIVPFFKPMRVQDGDWLKSFREDGQSFEEYLNTNPTLPTTERQTIYIQPIGNFTNKQREILQITADYMKAFYNLPVKLNSEQKLKKCSQRNGS